MDLFNRKKLKKKQKQIQKLQEEVEKQEQVKQEYKNALDYYERLVKDVQEIKGKLDETNKELKNKIDDKIDEHQLETMKVLQPTSDSVDNILNNLEAIPNKMEMVDILDEEIEPREKETTEETTEEFELFDSHKAILEYLESAEDNPKSSDIIDNLDYSETTIYKNLNKLENHNYIERKKVGKFTFNYLTDKGKKELE